MLLKMPAGNAEEHTSPLKKCAEHSAPRPRRAETDGFLKVESCSRGGTSRTLVGAPLDPGEVEFCTGFKLLGEPWREKDMVLSADGV